jgi:molybdopterin-guanine dinucleotide biosynthesis protein MobB
LTNINTAADVLRATAPRWLQVAGYSGTGKTRTLTRLVTRLAAAGETTEVWKISHHPVAPSQPHRDSARLLQAGARVAWVWGEGGLLAHGDLSPARIAQASATSWLLVEGGRRWPTPKILLVSESWPEHQGPLLATAGNRVNDGGGPALHCDATLPDEAERVADWIFEHRFLVSVPVREVAPWPSAN